MHEVSITDELRKWWVRRFPVMDSELHKDFSAIADSIDAEHHRQLDVLYRDMSDAEWVRLPLDADGVPIHIGDVMEWVRYGDDDKTIVREVSGVGVEAFFAWSDEQGRYAQYEAHAYRHHHADSWERIIDAPSYQCTIDRIDTDGDYEPTNCRWVPMSIQLKNRRATGKALAGDAE